MLCCVPNCKFTSTNGSSQRSCFKFPTNKSMREEWLRQIPEAKYIKQNNGICILHFEDRFIKRSKENPLRGRLIDGAVPTIFSKNDSEREASADVVSEHVVIELDGNDIDSFEALKSDLEAKLQMDDWKVAYSETSLHIYRLMVEPSGNLRVETSISVDSDLVLKMFHLDKLLGMKFSKQTVHRSVKLKGWSHLQKFLNKFNNPQELRIHSQKIRYE